MPMARAMAAKSGFLQIDAGFDEARGFHFQRHEAENTVVVDDDFYRELHLSQGEEVTHEHAEAPVAGE